MKRVIVYNSEPRTFGGNPMGGYAAAIERCGYKTELIQARNLSSTLVNSLREADILLWYGKLNILNELRLIRLLHNLRKPLLRMIWLLLIRKMNRPRYLLDNANSFLKVLTYNKLNPELYYCVHVRDDYSLLKKMGFRVFYMPPGINTEAYRPNFKNDDRFIILCNAAPATWQKGTDFLLKIIPALMKRVESSDFLIKILTGRAGISVLRQRLKSLQQIYPKNVMCLDYWIPAGEMIDLLAEAHLLVFPSRFEGLPLRVLETLSCGTPVIAFNIPGVRDVIVDGLNGSLVKPYNVDAFVAAILNLYRTWKHEPEIYHNMQKSARNAVLRFDWRVIERTYVRNVLKSF